VEKKVFYKVSEDAWLFRDATVERGSNDTKWTPHEEAVRQWCVQELIRVYGVRIDHVEVERPVKVARDPVFGVEVSSAHDRLRGKLSRCFAPGDTQ
jgi:hypothetical protein